MKLNNGIEIPEIGYGTFPSKEELVCNIPIALECGYRMFDTSEDYFNMEYIGEGLSRIDDTNDMFIVTKISWPHEIFDMEATIKKYQKQFKIDRPIDCVLIHFPSPFTYIDMWRELEKVYEKGLCKSIGVCNFEVNHLKRLMKKARIKPMINQIEFHPTFQQEGICYFCKQNDIQVMAYSPLARMNCVLIGDSTLSTLAEKYGKSVPQIILRWNLQKKIIPLPAAKSKEHIISNIDIFDFSLNEDDMNIIDSLECNNRVRYSEKTFYSTKQRIQFLKIHIKYTIFRIIGRIR